MVLAYTGGTIAETACDGRFYLVVGSDLGYTKGGGSISHTFEIRPRTYDQYSPPIAMEVRKESFEFKTKIAQVTMANLLAIMPGSTSLDGGATVGALGTKGTLLTEQEINIYIIGEIPCARIKIPAATIVLDGPIEIGEDVDDIVYPVTISATYDSSQSAGRCFVEYTTSTSTSDLIVASCSPAEGASVTSALMPVVVTFNKVVSTYYRTEIDHCLVLIEGLATVPVVVTAAWGSSYKTLTISHAASFTSGATHGLYIFRITDAEGKWISGDGSTANTAYTNRFIG